MDKTITSSTPGQGRIPVTLLTGFLGAGKTTLLNRLIRHPGLEGTAVLINEFGEVGIDHHLVETVDEAIVLLDSGCLCCSMRGDFINALKSLHERLSRREIPDLRRIIVETTGVADPVPILRALMEERYLRARFVCDGVLTVVDGCRKVESLAAFPEAMRQIAMADRLLISKGDQGDRGEREALEAWLGSVNPSAPRYLVSHGRIEPGLLFHGGVYAPTDRLSDLSSWLGGRSGHDPEHRDDHDRHHGHGHHGGGEIGSFTVTFPDPVSWRGLAGAMGIILMEHGARILRAKGIVGVRGGVAPLVVQCVQDVAYPPVSLRCWPDSGPLADRQGRLVFIVRGLGEHDVDAIRGRLADLPDDAAAMRLLARMPTLPTRCWFAQRLAWMGSGSFETAGWVVQAPVRARSGEVRR